VSDGVLLDTCALLWLMEEAEFSAPALERVNAATQERSLWVSPISAWEVGVLASTRRLVLSMPVQTWFDTISDMPGVGLIDLTPSVYIESSFLPGSPPGDIADRLLISAARAHALTIITRDAAMLDYAAEGHVRAIRC
jgi:PIN domain nuclease of toxin-antitoxin system